MKFRPRLEELDLRANPSGPGPLPPPGPELPPPLSPPPGPETPPPDSTSTETPNLPLDPP